MNEKLNPDRVDEVFMDCLFRDGEPTEPRAVAEGITMNCGFHPERIAKATETIREMLMELPEQFLQSKGGGWSFLQACQDRHGEQWTGLHRTMEQLFLLGIAAGTAKCLMPRDLWSVMPGGMPYYAVLDNGAELARA